MKLPPSAKAAGFTLPQHIDRIRAGSAWCVDGRHYVQLIEMSVSYAASCQVHARERWLASKQKIKDARAMKAPQ